MSKEALRALAGAQVHQSLSYVRVFVYEIQMNPVFMLLSQEQRAEAVGMYVLAMLMSMVIGHLPADTHSLARVLGVTEKVLQRTWPLLTEFFVEVEGKITHPRIQMERLEILRISNARRGVARQRWGNQREAGNAADADANGVQLDVQREEEKETDREPPSRKHRHTKMPERNTSTPNGIELVAGDLVDRWNKMAALTKGQIEPAAISDLPIQGLDAIAEELGGISRIQEAMDLIPGKPFYLGQNGNGWKASLPWLLKAKSIANLLKGSGPSTAPGLGQVEMTSTDQALIAQLGGREA